ncbi:MAG TPA: hypothetical protein QF800_00630 [Phycisphaerales bacterium]|nr:hypothetical protein [Phycisphaerales bacterium]
MSIGTWLVRSTTPLLAIGAMAVIAMLLLILAPQGNQAYAAWAGPDLSDYLVVAGRSGRGDEEVLWLLDTRSGELIVAGWDRQEKRFVPLGRRSLTNDVEESLRAR